MRWLLGIRERLGDWPKIAVGTLGSAVFATALVLYTRAGMPETFTPPPSYAQFASNGKLQSFTTLSPQQIANIFDGNTDVAAHAILKSEFGKLIAITGNIIEIRDEFLEDGGITVQIGSHTSISAISATLDFPPKWNRKLGTFKKGDRLYAVCRLADAAASFVSLEACDLVSP